MKPENTKKWVDAYGDALKLTNKRSMETALLTIGMIYQESLETMVGAFIEGYRKERDTKSRLVEHLKTSIEKGRQDNRSKSKQIEF